MAYPKKNTMQRPNSQLITRYFNGNCNAEETEVVEAYLALDIDQDYLAQCLSEASKALHDQRNLNEETQLALEKNWKVFQAFTEAAKIPKPRAIQRKLNKRLMRFGWAAAILIAISLFGVKIYQKSDLGSPYITVSSNTTGSKKITLPDSSVLWLNASTEIRYKEGFGQSHRDIELSTGEVLFEVRRMPSLPFKVRSKDIQTQVLGTSFVITAYDKLPYASVQVVHGKVAIQTVDKNYATLNKGQSVRYDKQLQSSSMGTFEKAVYDPINQHLFLQEASFEEFAMRIKDYYGYSVISQDKAVLQRRFTVEIAPHIQLKELLENLSWIHHGHYQMVGKEVYMH